MAAMRDNLRDDAALARATWSRPPCRSSLLAVALLAAAYLVARSGAAAKRRPRHRPGPGRIRRVRQALRRAAEGKRHRGPAAHDRGRGGEHRPAAPARRRGRHRLRPGRCRRRPAAAIDEGDVADDGLVSLGSLFYEPVWLFYRGDSAERLLHAPELTNLTQLAGWRVNIGAPGSGVPNIDESPARGQSRRPGDAHPDPRVADAGRRRPARRPHRRGRLRLGARGAAGADAAADAGHPPVRLRPGRGLLAPLPVPQPGDPAARRGRPRARHPAGRRAPGRADGDPGGEEEHPSGADPAVRRRRRSRSTAAPAGSAARASSRTRATPSGRSPRRRSASTPAGRRCCSATCRSGSPT